MTPSARLALVLFTVALLAPARPAPGADAPGARPNVLLICVDDLKPALGCYGDPHAKTPHIDRLATRGVRFTAAYANQAVCSPSRNALLTGLRPQTLGIYDLGTNFRRAAPTIRTLPQLFRDAGWHAAGLGKIFHVGHGNRDDAESWDEPLFRGRTVQYHLPANRGPSREEARFEGRANPGKLPRGSATEMADVDDDTYDDGRIAAEAVRRLHAAAAAPGKPFFLAVGFLKPHLPFVAPKRYWDLHDPASLPLPATRRPPEGAPPYAATEWGELRQYKDTPDTGPIDEALTRKLIHGYYAATSYADAQIGRLLAALDETGLAANTIVVLWGDHGWHLGDHGMWCKHTNYEQATRVPLVIAAPGVAGGTATAALVETVDILPTLLDLAGLPAAPGRDGRSFAPVLGDPARSARDHCVHVYPRGDRLGRAIRTADRRLVEWRAFGAAPETADIELYDVSADPDETRNVAAERPDEVARLRALLDGHPLPRRPLGGARAEDRTVETVHEPPVPAVEGVLRYRTRYRLWIPAGDGPLRGLVVHQHGCGKGASDGSRTGADDLQWQALARAWRCGLLVPTYETTDGDECRAWCDPRRGSDEAFLAALDRLAEASGCPEVAVVPWCLWGHSGGGFWATIMLERHPERVVAAWLRSGSPFPAIAKGEIPPLDFGRDAAFAVPIACNPGIREKGDARFAAAWSGAVDTLAFFRARGAPVLFAPDPRTGHECGESRALAIPFFARMLEARLPHVAGTAGPLRALDMGGALGTPLDGDDMPGEPRPLAECGDARRCGWLPDAAFAAKWRDYLRDGRVADVTPPPPPRDLRAAPRPGGRWHVAWRADADPESGLAGFSVRRGGEEIARIGPENGRTLLQGLSYHDTPTGPTPPFEVEFARGDAADTLVVVALNGAGVESTPAPVDLDDIDLDDDDGKGVRDSGR